MRKLFVSYARENKPDIDQLVEHLGMMGYDTWLDEKLRGGQDWWREILQRITDSDAFIAIISHAALNSTACGREFEWADALGKPIVPLAIEPPPTALPSRFVRRQIVDYSEPAERTLAALKLQGGLATLPPAPPLPEPLPKPPAPPLSYLTDLIDLITQPETLDYDQQHQILVQLEPALRSTDPEERRGGRDIMERFSARRDLYADVDRAISRLTQLAGQPAAVDSDRPAHSTTGATTAHSTRRGNDAPAQLADQSPHTTTHNADHHAFTGAGPADIPVTEERPTTDEPPAPHSDSTQRARRMRPRRRTVIAVAVGVVVLVAATVGILVGVSGRLSRSSSTAPPSPPRPSQTDLGFSDLALPGGVAVDTSGTVYVTDINRNRILKRPAGGTSSTLVTLGDQFLPGNVAVDNADNVYVIDTDNWRVVKVAAASNYQTVVPSTGTPSGVAADAAGNVYLHDDRGVVKLAAGTLTPTVLPINGPSFAVDGAGNVYVADVGRVLKLAVGTPTPTVFPFTLDKPGSTAVDGAGNVYVLDNNTVVRKLSTSSATQTVLPFTVIGNGQIIALAADNAGNVYVADYSVASEGGRVSKVSVG